MIGYPLDSKVTFNEAGIPEFDRAISSAPLRTLIGKLFSNGVLPNPSTNLQVVAGTSGMTVVVKKGFAIVNGCLKLEETDRTLTLQASETNYDRIDTIVVRLNDESNARYCDLYVVTGTPATNPVRPELTRNASVYEIGLADIFVSKNTSTITQQRITDTRYETDRCGIISSISEFDTTTLYEQIQSDLSDFKTEEQADFIAWFENIKTILDGNVAGHLQNEIDALDTRVTANENAIASHDADIAQLTDDVSKKASQKLVGEEYTKPSGGVYITPNTFIVFNDDIYRCKSLTQGSPADNPSAWELIGSLTKAVEKNYKIAKVLSKSATGSITKIGTSSGTIDNNVCVRSGNVVNVGARIYNVNLPGNGDYFNIPVGFRPKRNVNCTGVVVFNNTIIPVIFTIKPDGNVNFYYSSATSGVTQFSFTGCYGIEETEIE